MNIPQRWNDALRALHDGGFPEAIIMGGALRDLDNGRRIKDVDIFVMGDGEASKAALDIALGQDGEVLDVDLQAYENCTPDLVCVINYPDMEDPPFQVIVMPKSDPATFAADQMARFDIGLCRILYDGETVSMSPDYLSDKANRALTIVNAPSPVHLAASQRRVARLLEKYEGYAHEPLPADDDY